MKDLLPRYKQILNLQTATFSLIEHEDAMVAIVYKITQPNGKELILKICERTPHYLREIYFLTHLAETLPVPKIIQAIEPSQDVYGAILMECLPGALLKTEELTEPLAYEIGSCLARIHLNRLKGYGDLIQGNLSTDPRTYFTLKFEEGLEECKHHLPVRLLEKCQRYYTANLDLLAAVDGPCMVHRDFRPGNLMVHNGKLQGIIDWVGVRASFAEEDLFSMEHGEWIIPANFKNAFLNGYASVRPIPNYVHLVPFLRLNKAIATIGFLVRCGTWETSAARLYSYNRQFLESLFKNE